MMQINIERLIDLIIEWYQADQDYRLSSAKYYRQHGCGVWLDRAKTQEERHIVYLNGLVDRCCDSVVAVAEVLMMDREQIERMYAAARVARRWYERTAWQNRLPRDLLRRLEVYVFGA